MTQITLKGNPVQTAGALPRAGTPAPDFSLTKSDLTVAHLKDYTNQTILLNIFPSLDTEVCAKSVRTFNELMFKNPHITVLCISADLPFAQKRFCGIEGLNKVTNLSCFRSADFGKDYGVTIQDGPLQGLLSRAIVLIDPKGIVQYTEQVSEITDEPDYQAILRFLGPN